MEIDLLKYKSELRMRRNGKGKLEVFDTVRRKFLIVQPEELVRQLTLNYLILEKNYPLSKIRVEMGLTVNDLQKRCDILIFDNQIKPHLLVECKAANVPIDQSVFDQIARYNLVFKVPFLVVTNGLSTFCCKMDYDTEGWELLDEIPNWIHL